MRPIGADMATRLARLEARRRREELVLARHRRRARGDALNRELRLGATLEPLGSAALDPARLARWLDRAATALRAEGFAHDALHRRGDAHLLCLAAADTLVGGDTAVGDGMDERARRTATRIARGALVVAAGLDELPRTVMIGLLLSTAPGEIDDALGDRESDGRGGVPADSPCVSGDDA